MADSVSARLVRAELLALPRVPHGSVGASELARLGLLPREVVDFSVNTNPLGPAPTVLAAIGSADWSRYPGDDEWPLRRTLAERAGVEAAQVVLGNGSAELLWLVALASLRPGERAAIVGPTFGEYARAARVVGAEVYQVEAPAAATDARVLFLCNPNNPTGAYRQLDEITRLLDDAPDRLLVLDEAYTGFVDERWPSEPLLRRGNLVILRSMTKDHALPGLRLGYALATPDVALALEAVRPPWSVNAGALRAGLAALEPDALAHLAGGRAVVRAARRQLTEGLQALGYRVWPSRANFLLVEVGDGARLRQALLPHGLVVRDCGSFGLAGCVRIACREEEDCRRLLEVLARLDRPHAGG
ncbi:MAG: histidinol-phosphate aminotransferase family protein [Chloroflexi bacterium]|nr:histidinol-phosphate aminotransferase family protein [Chloroflexota bacterium]